MGFIPYKVDGSNRPESLEYLPAAAITPEIGMALYWDSSNGVLAKCTGYTNKPTHICKTKGTAALTAGDVIPVTKINPDVVYEVPSQADNSSTNLGAMVQIHTDGCQVTATTSNSPKVQLVGKGPKGGVAGDVVYVRIP